MYVGKRQHVHRVGRRSDSLRQERSSSYERACLCVWRVAMHAEFCGSAPHAAATATVDRKSRGRHGVENSVFSCAVSLTFAMTAVRHWPLLVLSTCIVELSKIKDTRVFRYVIISGCLFNLIKNSLQVFFKIPDKENILKIFLVWLFEISFLLCAFPNVFHSYFIRKKMCRAS